MKKCREIWLASNYLFWCSRVALIAFVMLINGCASEVPLFPRLPDELPKATGPIQIYSLGSEREIKTTPAYADLHVENLESFEDGYYKIIDKAELSDPGDGSALIRLLNRKFRDVRAFLGCFEPRHLLQYPSIYGEVTALICFQCRKAHVDIDGWSKMLYFRSIPKLKVERFYDKYNVRKPVSD